MELKYVKDNCFRYKKKYKADFDEIRKMSKSKTKSNAPIAKTAFEEESLDKDQQFIEGTTSTYHSTYTQDDLNWANGILDGTIKGSEQDKADAQKILDNYAAENPGTVAINGAIYDKNEVKFKNTISEPIFQNTQYYNTNPRFINDNEYRKKQNYYKLKYE